MITTVRRIRRHESVVVLTKTIETIGNGIDDQGFAMGILDTVLPAIVNLNLHYESR